MASLQPFYNWTQDLNEEDIKHPVLFIGHGSPMNGIEDNEFSQNWAKMGKEIPKPKASMFVWAPIPDKFKKLGSMKFAKKLMINADVAVAPGLAFGKNGEGFVRIGLVENTQRIRQAAKNIKKFLD